MSDVEAETALERECRATARSLAQIRFNATAALLRRAAEELARQRGLLRLRGERPTTKPLTMAAVERQVLGQQPADSEPMVIPVSQAERDAIWGHLRPNRVDVLNPAPKPTHPF